MTKAWGNNAIVFSQRIQSQTGRSHKFISHLSGSGLQTTSTRSTTGCTKVQAIGDKQINRRLCFCRSINQKTIHVKGSNLSTARRRNIQGINAWTTCRERVNKHSISMSKVSAISQCFRKMRHKSKCRNQTQ